MFTLLTYRSRQEYVELLLSDLCKYYSYGKFLMEKFMDLFPINEVTELLITSLIESNFTRWHIKYINDLQPAIK